MPDTAELFDPSAHVPLTDTAWDSARARRAIAAIVVETESAFDSDSLWPSHPLDEAVDEPPLGRTACVYLGAAGVIWALHALELAGVAELGRDWTSVAVSLPERYRREPDFPDQGVIPSLMVGEAGILLVAHALAPSRRLEDRLLGAVRANVAATARPATGTPS